MLNSGRDSENQGGGARALKEQEDLEISDSEAPDIEDAKRKLRNQAEKKKKAKKTVVYGVDNDLEIAVDDP